LGHFSDYTPLIYPRPRSFLIYLQSKKQKTQTTEKTGGEISFNPTKGVVEDESANEDALLTAECAQFPENLKTCTKYTCQFTHPLTGEKMTREIVGIVNDKCSYTEEMPNNGQLNCNYTEDMRIAIAQHNKVIADTQSFGVELSVDLNPNGAEIKTMYTVDGKTTDSSSQEALDNGSCVITGY